MIAHIYVIHFDAPLGHARHYTGVAVDVAKRLRQHAHGQGSALTRAVKAAGIGWRLGGLYQAGAMDRFEVEQLAKARHRGADCCELCRGEEQIQIEGAVSVPLDSIPFPTDSESLG